MPKSSVTEIGLKVVARRPARANPVLDAVKALAVLRTMILRGDFPPAQRITEAVIMSRLGVSRTSTHIALARLAHEGLLEALVDGGFAVRTWTVVEIWDAIELRAVLEGTAARLACDRLVHRQELRPSAGCSRMKALSP